jgi:hypothetical protein
VLAAVSDWPIMAGVTAANTAESAAALSLDLRRAAVP